MRSSSNFNPHRPLVDRPKQKHHMHEPQKWTTYRNKPCTARVPRQHRGRSWRASATPVCRRGPPWIHWGCGTSPPPAAPPTPPCATTDQAVNNSIHMRTNLNNGTEIDLKTVRLVDDFRTHRSGPWCRAEGWRCRDRRWRAPCGARVGPQAGRASARPPPCPHLRRLR